MVHALEIPEIRAHLGSVLSSEQLAICAQVSSSWNNTFTPLLYRSCSVLSAHRRIPPFETINKHADFIRELCYSGEVEMGEYTLNCTKLTSLILLGGSRFQVNNLPYAAIGESLVLNNTATLSTFSLTSEGLGRYPSIWLALSQCPRINSIDVRSQYLPLSCMREFWEVCSNVEFLTLRFVSQPAGEDLRIETEVPLPDVFSRLRNLQLASISSISSTTQLSIALRSPNLVSLKLSVDYEVDPKIQEYRQAILAGRWSQLQKIDISGYELEDEDVALTLDAMTNAKVLALKESLYSESAHRSLMARHAMTIETIDLRHSLTITSSMVQAILSRCPSLEVLRANKICGTDFVRMERSDQGGAIGVKATYTIVIGEDWICLKLRILDLRFEMSDDVVGVDMEETTKVKTQELHQLEQDHAFQQISRLSRLERLTIGSAIEDNLIRPVLQLKLGSRGGRLHKLSTLKRLRFLDISQGQELSEQELDWMKLNWPKLATVHGNFHPSYMRQRELAVYNYNLFKTPVTG